MKCRVMIRSMPQAFEVIKEMGLDAEWEDADYRVAGRRAVAQVLEERMRDHVSEYVEHLGRAVGVDRRNGSFSRHLLTELGDIELHVPRTRRYSPLEVLRAYRRRAPQVDQLILACFVLGISTRKVAHALLPILGEPISASTVSRVARTLDTAVAAFHRRPLSRQYRFLIFDGVVLTRKTGAGAVKRVVLVALGMPPEGQKEVIDFMIAPGESQHAWEAFLTDLFRRGLDAEGVQLLITDGGTGLLAALPLIYPRIPLQRCWAHKTRNVCTYVRKKDHQMVKASLRAISHAHGLMEAQKALGRFKACWQPLYPKAVACLLRDEEELLAFFQIADPDLWPQIRTTNAIERRFREVRRRTRPMGVFSDRTSMERILYAVFSYENAQQGTGTPFLVLTQNS